MEKVFLHVPHSSTFIPKDQADKFTAELGTELNRMTDLFTDDLFDVGAERLVFPVSRLVCDVERFRDDKDEVMAAVGMGAVYTQTHDLKPLRSVTDEERESILREWYDPHQRRLEKMTEERLTILGKCLIIDCHSFSGAPLPYEAAKGKKPDICIGTDPFHTPDDLAGRLFERFSERGFVTEYDHPYSGCMIPAKYYRVDPRVDGVMIEVNRDLYLGADFRKNGNYGVVKKAIGEILRPLISDAEI